MLFPKVDPKEWAEKWGLNKESKCGNVDCGRMRELNIPYATKDSRGLTAEPCECGCMAPMHGAIIDGSFDGIV